MISDPAAEPFGVYLHIPFCASKCEYCAFATWTDRHHLTGRYLAAVRTDIERAVDSGMPPATTIFVGGGTPSLVPAEQLAELIASIPVRREDGRAPEISVECNPDNVTESMIRTYRDAGVTRVSIGVQSMNQQVLGALGRQHDRANVERAVEAVRSVGLTSFNLDLIYGVAGERVADWIGTLDDVLALDPPHISAYGLTIEPGTPLAAQPDRHPDDDDQAEKYHVTNTALEAVGLHNYEISNWARPGHECRHNLLYWRQQNYLGFGCAAHSHRDGRRWWNLRTPERYIDAVEAGTTTEAAGETLDVPTRAFERLELMLRLRDGVPEANLDGESLAGLVERVYTAEGSRWALTPAGRLLANEISTRLES